MSLKLDTTFVPSRVSLIENTYRALIIGVFVWINFLTVTTVAQFGNINLGFRRSSEDTYIGLKIYIIHNMVVGCHCYHKNKAIFDDIF